MAAKITNRILDESFTVVLGPLNQEEVDRLLDSPDVSGLPAEVLDHDFYIELVEGPSIGYPLEYSINEIYSRNQFIGKEHVHEYWILKIRQLGKVSLQTAVRGLGKLILPDTSALRSASNPVTPEDLGLVVATREEAELPLLRDIHRHNISRKTGTPETVYRNSRAVQVGSLIDFMALYPPQDARLIEALKGFSNNAEFFFRQFAFFLEKQIEKLNYS